MRKGAPREEYFQINTELTRRVAESAKKAGVTHFVFYSTVKVYGYDGDLKNHNISLTENTKCNPNDPYGESKYEAEKILKKMECDDFKVAIIRPPMVYGKGVKGNMLTLMKFVKYSPILPFNYGENRRSIVGINNLLHMTKLIIDKKGVGIFIGSDGNPVSIKEMVETIGKIQNKKFINIRLPKLAFWLLCKIKPNIMVRLYGSLAFEQQNNYVDIGYTPIMSMEEEMKG